MNMMLITRNKKAMIKGILQEVKEVTYYTHANNYEGEKVVAPLTEKEIRTIMDDIEERQATLWADRLHGGYELRYAGYCKWELKL